MKNLIDKETLSGDRLVYSNKVTDDIAKVLSNGIIKPNLVRIYQNRRGLGPEGWYDRGFEIDICDEYHIGFYLVSFKSMRDFKNWMKVLGITCNLRLVGNKTQFGRMYEGRLSHLVIDSGLYFNDMRDLPFFEDTEMWNSQSQYEMEVLKVNRFCMCGFGQKHRVPIMSNGSAVWGYIQATDTARILYRPNPNSQIYQPIVYDYSNPPLIF